VDQWPTGDSAGDVFGNNHLIRRQLADAIGRARDTRESAMSGALPLAPDTLGALLLDPVENGDLQVTGYIAAEIPYRQLLGHPVARAIEGGFGYRASDAVGTVLAVSPNYAPERDKVVRRRVVLPGGRSWQVDIAVDPFEPLLSRVILWVVGLLLLGLVVLI